MTTLLKRLPYGINHDSQSDWSAYAVVARVSPIVPVCKWRAINMSRAGALILSRHNDATLTAQPGTHHRRVSHRAGP